MPYAVKAGQLIDGSGSEPLRNAVVLVEDDRITAVGPAEKIAVPEGFELIDASSMTLTPGLIDAHVHLRGSGRPDDIEGTALGSFTVSPARMTYDTLKNAQSDLMAGFTTVRDCGSNFYADTAVRDAIDRGDFIGPRIWNCGCGVTATRGHMDREKGFADFVHLDIPNAECDTPAEARKVVMENINRGAKFIKMNITISENVRRYVWGCAPEMTKEMMEAAIQQAHWYGRKVTAHSHGGVGVDWALEAGIDGLEHAYFLTEEQLAFMKEHHVTFTPTLSVMGNTMNIEGYKENDPDLQKWYELVHSRVWDTVALAHKMGVHILAGTDALMPYCLHGNNATEMQWLVRCGFTPLEALTAATGGNADGLGIPDVGYIKEGKLADLVVWDCDPLEDITYLQDHGNIRLIMKGGETVLRRL